jgi:hypothetical protein
MLSVYGDESSDESKQRVFAVAGIIGPESYWEALESKWLARTEGVPFHANNCDSDHGDYEGKPHAENKALYRDLTVLLSESGLGGYGVAVDLVAQKEVFPEAPDIAYYKGFIEVLEVMNRCAEACGETVKFSFDSRAESEHNASFLFNSYRSSDEGNKRIFPKLSFLVSRAHPRIQIADLMARETMKAVDNRFGPKIRPARKSWLALYETQRFRIDCFGLAWFKGKRAQMPQLQSATGISWQTYQAWLAETRAQHSTTKLFEFGDKLDGITY